MNVVNNVLNVFPWEEIKWRNVGRVRRPRNWSTMPNPGPRKIYVNKFSDNASLKWRRVILLEQHICLVIFQTGVKDTAVARPGRSSLSLCVPQRKSSPTPTTSQNAKNTSDIYLCTIISICDWRKVFLISTFCSFDDLPSLSRTMLLHH